AEPGEGDHGHGADVEYGLHVFGERLPLLDGVRRLLVAEEDPHDIGPQFAQPLLDAPAVGTAGEVPPAIGLVQAVTQPHTHLGTVHCVLSPVVTTATP